MSLRACIPALVVISLLASCSPGSGSKDVTGALLVNTEPAQGAGIILNGKATGEKSDHRFARLKPGIYTVEATATGDQGGRPLRGEGVVEVERGRTARLTLQLTTQWIEVPETSSTSEPVAETEAQKSVLDYFQAITGKDYLTAYSLLTESQKRASGSFFRFKRSWALVESAKVTRLNTTKAEPGREEFDVNVLLTSVNPDDTTATAEQKLAITAIGVPQAGSTLWKLEGL